MMLLIHNFSEWLGDAYIYSFEIQAKHLYFMVIFLIISLSYVIIKPAVSWFVTLGSVRMLSFLTSSLVVMAAFLLSVLYMGEVPDALYAMLKITLHCLALLGTAIIIYHGFRQVVKK
jgi:sensor histidine kinase YesM